MVFYVMLLSVLNRAVRRAANQQVFLTTLYVCVLVLSYMWSHAGLLCDAMLLTVLNRAVRRAVGHMCVRILYVCVGTLYMWSSILLILVYICSARARI